MHLWQYFRTSHVCEISTTLTVMNSVITSVFQPLCPLNLKHKIAISHLTTNPTDITKTCSTHWHLPSTYCKASVFKSSLASTLRKLWISSIESIVANACIYKCTAKFCVKQIIHVHIRAFARPPWYEPRIATQTVNSNALPLLIVACNHHGSVFSIQQMHKHKLLYSFY
jgi:hypothetical protein